MIKYADSGSSTVFSQTTDSNGTITATVNLSDAANGELEVVTKITTNDGGSLSRSKTFGVVDHSDSGPSLLEGLGSLTGLLPSSSQGPFQTALAMLVTVVGTAGAASRFRLSTELVGIVALFFLTAFGVIGFVGYDIVFVAAVAWGSMSLLRRAL